MNTLPGHIDIKRKPKRDWTVIFFWAALFVSATMLTVRFTWDLGKSMRVAAYLEEYGMENCVGLHLPPGVNKEQASADIKATCERIVTAHHEPCLAQTDHLDQNLKLRRKEYTACMFTRSIAQAALD